jgi:sulfate/thiosulfate transport system ATP-binding protein
MSIVLELLTKRYGGQRVVDNVSLEVADGELFVLLGASGSGKSTILRMIAGLTPPTSGRILLADREVTHLAPQARGTGFVFQNYSVFRHMSVAGNIEFGLKIRKVAPSERAKKCEELLDMVGLAGLGGRYADQLSGGQQQRVALARAIAYEPSVLLLDEPLGALDVKIRAQLRRSLKEVQRRLSVTTILVTHDQDEAFELGDRIGVLDRGVLLELGEPEQLYANPKTLFVAGFLGSGTVLVGRTQNGEARFGPLILPVPEEAPHEEGASVELLARPEQIALSAEKPADGVPMLGKGAIIEETFSGPLRRLRLRLPRLPGTRQVSPVPPFGEEGLLVDAVVPAGPSASGKGKELWVSLSGWTILEQAPPRLLVVDTAAGSTTALNLAQVLATRVKAAVVVMGYAGESEASEELRAAFKQRISEADLPEPELNLRNGDFVEQLAAEQAGTLFEMVIVPAGLDEDRGTAVAPAVVAALERPDLPMLIAKGERPEIKRILICTRAGEPGKTDVHIGGRLARFLGATVTLLYITAKSAKPSPLARVHLEKASATLRGLEVANEIRIRPAATPTEGILREAAEHDLIVVGGHGPTSRSILGVDDVTLQVLTRADRPLLVVPAEES